MTSPTPSAVALQEAVERAGGQSSLARKVGCTQQAISKWLKKGKALPPELVLKVEGVTGVSRHDLRPDIYPREEPNHLIIPSLLEAAR